MEIRHFRYTSVQSISKWERDDRTRRMPPSLECEHLKGGSRYRVRLHASRKVVTRVFGCRIIVVLVDWLHEVHWDAREGHVQAAHDQWSSNQNDKNDEQGEVNDREADDPSLTKLGLLHGVDWWANLTAVVAVSQVLI